MKTKGLKDNPLKSIVGKSVDLSTWRTDYRHMSKTKDQMMDEGFVQDGELWIVPAGWPQEGDVVSFAQARELLLQHKKHMQLEARYVQHFSPRGRTSVDMDDWN